MNLRQHNVGDVGLIATPLLWVAVEGDEEESSVCCLLVAPRPTLINKGAVDEVTVTVLEVCGVQFVCKLQKLLVFKIFIYYLISI